MIFFSDFPTNDDYYVQGIFQYSNDINSFSDRF